MEEIIMSKYPTLFSPIEVRRLTIPNRIVMPPMGTNYAKANGEISDEHINYYELRAQGGTGLIIVENVCVKFPEGSNGTTQLRMDHDMFIPKLYKLTEAVHAHGTKIAVQLNHAGASAMSARTGVPTKSSSNHPSKTGGAIPTPLTKDEIYAIAKDYGAAARRAQLAGFDAVEVHAGHSYLISQFLSPIYNDRTDEFGGSPENRARFCKLVMEEVRAAIGPMMPIILRFSTDEFIKGGNTVEDTIELLKYCQEEADILHASCALNDSIRFQIDANHFEDGWRAYMAKAIKEAFGKPTITMGNIRDPKVAEDILSRGDADFVALGRGLIADPEWGNKCKYGREDELRKCISCNIGCAGNRIGYNKPIRCTVNPDVLHGEVYKETKVKKPCNVVVIGAGTAGLEAACTAAEVGCTTFLLEKTNELGGLAKEISKFPDKKRLNDFPTYLINRAKRLKNLFIFTGVDVTAEGVKSFNPDFVVNATGSVPTLPPIPGLHDNLGGGTVFSILDLIKDVENGVYPDDLSGKKVVVIGGGAVGLDVVEYFAPRGAEVSIVEMLPAIGRDLDPVTKNDTSSLMEKYGVKQYVSTALKEVRKDNYLVERNGELEELPFDYGFVCLGMRSNAPLYQSLVETFNDTDVEVINIGDSNVRARRIIEGTREGRDILKRLKYKGFM
jgi:2,4-dienoyl-CoA reductase-like NADH-dependent reductase (Old Yellow Enzyme family)/thioredoxin reductase